MTSIAKSLYVHLVDNIPAVGAAAAAAALDVTILLDGAAGIFTLAKGDVTSSTTYDVEVPDVQAIGLDAHASADEIDAALTDLTLALNAASPRAVFSAQAVVASVTLVRRDVPAASPSVTDHVRRTLSSGVGIDAAQVLNLFRRSRLCTRGSLERRVLDNFSEAGATREWTAAVRQYGAVVEMCLNRGRDPQLDGAELDLEVAKVAGISLATAGNIRTICNRTKHADRSPSDQAKYARAANDPPGLLRDSRFAATVVLQRTILA
jgi:hypothetical protein